MYTPVYIGLGSNLGASATTISEAIKALASLAKSQFVKASSHYLSKPLADMDQPDYVNAVVLLETELDPESLLDQLQNIENEFGRERKERWGARTLDLDILMYGDQCIQSERLTIPHPGLAERDFVLVPLGELSPDLVVPELGPLNELIKSCELRGLQKLV